jgi:hypothetical protein
MARTESITPEKKEILLAVYDDYRKARDLEGRCVQGSHAAKKAKTEAEAAIGRALKNYVAVWNYSPINSNDPEECMPGSLEVKKQRCKLRGSLGNKLRAWYRNEVSAPPRPLLSMGEANAISECKPRKRSAFQWFQMHHRHVFQEALEEEDANTANAEADVEADGEDDGEEDDEDDDAGEIEEDEGLAEARRAETAALRRFRTVSSAAWRNASAELKAKIEDERTEDYLARRAAWKADRDAHLDARVDWNTYQV